MPSTRPRWRTPWRPASRRSFPRAGRGPRRTGRSTRQDLSGPWKSIGTPGPARCRMTPLAFIGEGLRPEGHAAQAPCAARRGINGWGADVLCVAPYGPEDPGCLPFGAPPAHARPVSGLPGGRVIRATPYPAFALSCRHPGAPAPLPPCERVERFATERRRARATRGQEGPKRQQAKSCFDFRRVFWLLTAAPKSWRCASIGPAEAVTARTSIRDAP